jgi:hypothetical protein
MHEYCTNRKPKSRGILEGLSIISFMSTVFATERDREKGWSLQRKEGVGIYKNGYS